MASINFYLANEVIMASMSLNKMRIRVSTGDKIKSVFWDQKKQQSVVNPVFDGRELNMKLQRQKTWFMNEIRRLENDGKRISSQLIRDGYLQFIGRKSVESNGELVGLLKQFASSDSYRPQTRAIYRRLLELIEGMGHVGFDSINEDFYNRFVKHVQSKTGNDNSVGVYIKSLKHALNVAFDQGLTTCVEQKKKYFKMLVKESDQVVLSTSDIKHVYQVSIKDDRTRFIRDLFVLTCYTGFRYSDYVQYSPENIIASGTILQAHTRKTGEMVCIPLHPVAKEILERIFKSPMRIPTNAGMNRAIKRVMKLCAFTTDVRRTYNHNGQTVFEVSKKWENISCHTARRSFATNAYLAGVPTMDIMKMTGHRTELSFRKYVRVDKLQTAERNISHPFFNL